MNASHSDTSANLSRFQGLVDIGGRRLFVEVAGEGTPTVVLEMSGGGTVDDWNPVWPAVTALTHVVRYDRAGLGKSDRASGTRTCVDMVADLHRLLQLIPVPSPYVLVGASIGGLTTRVYAHQYPHDIVGMVLVDPTHDSHARELALLPPERTDESPGMRELRQYLTYRMPQMFEPIDLEACQTQARATGSLEDIPLVVVTGMRRRTFPDMPPELTARRYKLKFQLHSEWARLSSNGVVLPAENSGHDVTIDEPATVIKAICFVLDAVRGRQSESR